MKSVARFLLIVLLLEVTLFVPGMVAIFGFMPDRLDVELESEVPLSVSVGFVSCDANSMPVVTCEQFAGCLPGRDIAPIRFYFADDFREDSFMLKFSGVAPRFKIKSITLVRNLLMRFKVPIDGLRGICDVEKNSKVSVEDGCLAIESAGRSVTFSQSASANVDFAFCGFELPDLPGVNACFWGFQFLLMFLALIGIKTGKKIVDKPKWAFSLLIAGIGGFFFAVALPAQTIFGNRDVFDFPVIDVLAQLSMAFVGCCLVFYLMLHLLSRLFGYWPHLFMVALIAYEYLHTGILSAGHPSLNGSIVFYMNRANAMSDFICLGVVFSTFVLFAKWIKGWLHWIAIALFVMTVASLFDVRSVLQSTVEATAKSDIPWVHNSKEIADGLHLSPERNVILLIPDSNQSDAAFDVIRKDDNLRAEFSGFCAFNNNIGMHEDTRSALPGILSGEWCPDPVDGETYIASVFKARSRAWSGNSVVTEYENANLPVYVLTGCDGLAHSNRIEHRDSKKMQHEETGSIFYRRTKSMGLCLMDCYRFRVVPFILKMWALRVSFLGIRTDDGTGWERTLYPLLSSSPLSEERETALTVIHTEGSHAPVHFDADGNRIYKDKDNYKGYCGQVHFVMKCIAVFLKDLKQKGIYDKSLIIIVGDHGIQDPMANWPDTGDVPSGAMPMLWVKPFGASGELTATEIPTSHAKIAALMKQSIDKNLALDQIMKILETNRRHFRKGRDFDTAFSDMYFDARGRRVEN